ncbi:phage-related minor tail protein, partial [Microbacterium sp. 1154]|nr:phage-related minor tail protein [Microbacterium sp. 1154]
MSAATRSNDGAAVILVFAAIAAAIAAGLVAVWSLAAWMTT